MWSTRDIFSKFAEIWICLWLPRDNCDTSLFFLWLPLVSAKKPFPFWELSLAYFSYLCERNFEKQTFWKMFLCFFIVFSVTICDLKLVFNFSAWSLSYGQSSPATLWKLFLSRTSQNVTREFSKNNFFEKCFDVFWNYFLWPFVTRKPFLNWTLVKFLIQVWSWLPLGAFFLRNVTNSATWKY